MRQRQKAQKHLVAEPEHFEQTKSAAAIGKDVAVGGHHPFRNAAGARGEDQTGDVIGGEFGYARCDFAAASSPLLNTSSHVSRSTALACPAAGSIAITLLTVSA